MGETCKAPLFAREAHLLGHRDAVASARHRVWCTEGAPSYFWQGKDDGRGGSVCALAPLDAVTATWSVQPNRNVEEETTQVGGGKGLTVCLCKRAHEGEHVTGQLSHDTLATAHAYNGTWPISKKKKKRCAFASPHTRYCDFECASSL